MRLWLACLLCLLVAPPAGAQNTTLSGTTIISGETSVGKAGGSGGGGEPEVCALPLIPTAECMRTIYHPGTWDRRADISYGADPGEQKLTTMCDVSGCGNIMAAIPPGTVAAPGSHPALVIRGNSPPVTAWVVAYDPASHPTYGDGEACTEIMTEEINGQKGVGVALLITEGSNQAAGACGANDGGAYIGVAVEGKNTDYNSIERVNLCTGARTLLAGGPVNGLIGGQMDQYGGSIPPANCDHNRGQVDWHENCHWYQVCMALTTTGSNITLTLRSWRIGPSGGWVKGAPEGNDPGPPAGTTAYPRYLMGTHTYGPAPRAANIHATGMIGIAGIAVSGTTHEGAATNLRWSTTPQP